MTTRVALPTVLFLTTVLHLPIAQAHSASPIQTGVKVSAKCIYHNKETDQRDGHESARTDSKCTENYMQRLLVESAAGAVTAQSLDLRKLHPETLGNESKEVSSVHISRRERMATLTIDSPTIAAPINFPKGKTLFRVGYIVEVSASCYKLVSEIDSTGATSEQRNTCADETLRQAVVKILTALGIQNRSQQISVTALEDTHQKSKEKFISKKDGRRASIKIEL